MLLIRKFREAEGYTQTYIAKILGINQKTYSKYENEKLEISYKDLIKLADLYGVSLDILVGRKRKI